MEVPVTDAVDRVARALWSEVSGTPIDKEKWKAAPEEVRKAWHAKAMRVIRTYEGWETPYPCDRTPADLLMWVMDHLVRRVNQQGQPRWKYVMEFCGMGSTMAQNMCRWWGQDPDERVTVVKHYAKPR